MHHIFPEQMSMEKEIQERNTQEKGTQEGRHAGKRHWGKRGLHLGALGESEAENDASASF